MSGIGENKVRALIDMIVDGACEEKAPEDIYASDSVYCSAILDWTNEEREAFDRLLSYAVNRYSRYC